MKKSDITLSPRQSRKDRTQRLILDAAIQLFAQRGFDGTNFREITEQCGAKRSLVLYHFNSKEELWQIAVEDVSKRFNTLFESGLKSLEPLADDRMKVRCYMNAYICAMVAIPEYGQILSREGSCDGPRLRWLVKNFAPPLALEMSLEDKAIERRITQTLVRDIITSTLLSMVVYRPLLDLSLSGVLKKPATITHSLSDKQKDELIEHLLSMIFEGR